MINAFILWFIMMVTSVGSAISDAVSTIDIPTQVEINSEIDYAIDDGSPYVASFLAKNGLTFNFLPPAAPGDNGGIINFDDELRRGVYPPGDPNNIVIRINLDSAFQQQEVSSVPITGTMLLLGPGLLGVAVIKRRMSK
ncbi:MAG: hypothetical protein L7F78_11055 [Syntrophales bacterium LBB04]|nr:hypothetical protein [Syntrophales bacterium LBB04]